MAEAGRGVRFYLGLDGRLGALGALAFFAQVVAASLAVFGVPAVHAAGFPEKPIRLIVPFGPGGATDVATRVIADGMARELKQPVVVENRPGANGAIAIREVASARPDGYTVLVGNVTTNVINPLIQGAAAGVDVQKDLSPVVKLVEVPAMLIATQKNFPPNNVQELVSHAKKNPKGIFYNTAGILAYSHLDMLELQRRAGIELEMVPYSAGGGGGQNDIVSGEIQLALRNVASAASFVKAGQIKALAVTTDERLPSFPDVPTMKEQGFAGVGTNAWQAMFVPAGTPPDVAAAIANAARSTLDSPLTRERFDRLQILITPTRDAAEARQWLAGEFQKWQVIAADGKKRYEGR